MRYVKLGSSDIEVSVIGFGAWAIGGMWWGGTEEKDSIKAIKISLDSGINFIDTAPAYGKGLSEERIAKAIKGKRDRVIISTKCGLRWDLKKGNYFFDYEPGDPFYRYLGKESIEQELDNSLKRLQTDYVDLYQTHWQDSTTPIEETMGVLLKLKKKGKIRAIGVSNIEIGQLKEYSKYGTIDSDQEKYSMLDREIENELLPWCIKNGASLLAYSPLSKGLLSGKISPDRKFPHDDTRSDDERFSAKNIEEINKLIEKYLVPLAKKHNVRVENIAIAYLLKNPSVIALCGARNTQQAQANALSADIFLDSQDLEMINNFILDYQGK